MSCLKNDKQPQCTSIKSYGTWHKQLCTWLRFSHVIEKPTIYTHKDNIHFLHLPYCNNINATILILIESLVPESKKEYEACMYLTYT